MEGSPRIGVEREQWGLIAKWTVLSSLVGVIAGCGGIIFEILTQLVTRVSLVSIVGYTAPETAGELTLFPPPAALDLGIWLLLPVIILGGLLSGWLVYTFAPEAEGHGTDAAINAFHHQEGLIRKRIPFIKTMASALTLGTGGSGGREGPIALIGAAFGSYLATVLKLSVRDRRILLAAGIGAGIAAIFRAPIAGALFAAEILYSEADLETDAIIPAAAASLVSYSVFTFWLPAEIRHLPLFGSDLQGLQWNSVEELFLYVVLALVLVPVGAIYIRTFYGTQWLFQKCPCSRKLRPALGAALTGLLGIGLFKLCGSNIHSLAVLGAGYGTLQSALINAGAIGVPLLLTIAAIKILTTSLTISSGGSGGVFGPSMVIGGCVGSSVGLILHWYFPSLVPHPEAFGIVGMAGFFAGCAHAPFSTILMVSEITGSYGLLLPTMGVSTVTFVLGRPWKLYIKQVPNRQSSPAHQGEMGLPEVLSHLRVSDILHPIDTSAVAPLESSLPEITAQFATSHELMVPVVDQQNQFRGLLDLAEVRGLLAPNVEGNTPTVQSLTRMSRVTLSPQDPLSTALARSVQYDQTIIPVMSSDSPTRLLGLFHQRDALRAIPHASPSAGAHSNAEE